MVYGCTGDWMRVTGGGLLTVVSLGVVGLVVWALVVFVVTMVGFR